MRAYERQGIPKITCGLMSKERWELLRSPRHSYELPYVGLRHT